MIKKRIRDYWEGRAARFGTDQRGVLYESLPLEVNRYIHAWEAGVVSRFLADLRGGTLLDVGCGYGRLSSEAWTTCQRVRIFGADISSTFCRMFAVETRRPAVAADALGLPFKDASFDLALVSTVLMYLMDDESLKAAVSEISRVLRSGGRCLVIENNSAGAIATEVFRLLAGRGSPPAKSERYFRRGELEKLFSARGMVRLWETGIPVFSALMAPFAVAAKVSGSVTRLALAACRAADRALGSMAGLSIYVAAAYEKPR